MTDVLPFDVPDVRAQVTDAERSVIERLRRRIYFHDGHWLYTGHTSKAGYGYISLNNTDVLVHRLTYRLFVGPLDPMLEIDHLCRVTQCCAPAHLEQVTHHVNVLRGQSPAAICSRRNECSAGHPYVDGSYIVRRGIRECLQCRNEANRLRYVPKGPHDFTGANNPAVKLTLEQVREIRAADPVRGFTRALADRYSVSPALISAIRTGRLWGTVQ